MRQMVITRYGAPAVIARAPPKWVSASSRIAALMAGTELVEPGVVWLSEWRPEPFDPRRFPRTERG